MSPVLEDTPTAPIVESHFTSLYASLRDSQVVTSVTQSISEMGFMNAVVTTVAPILYALLVSYAMNGRS